MRPLLLQGKEQQSDDCGWKHDPPVDGVTLTWVMRQQEVRLQLES